jgi:hypothetical protein
MIMAGISMGYADTDDTSADIREGLQVFMDKRKSQWQGH